MRCLQKKINSKKCTEKAVRFLSTAYLKSPDIKLHRGMASFLRSCGRKICSIL